MNGRTKVTTLVRNTKTGESKTVTQNIELTEHDELIYTVEGSDHEVKVNALTYVDTLRELTGL